MAKNFIQRGEVITVVAGTGGVKCGDVVISNALVGIAATDAAEGAPVEIELGGVWELPKTSAQAWASIGAKVYFDATEKVVTTTVGSNKLIGAVIEPAANPSAKGKVLLNRFIA